MFTGKKMIDFNTLSRRNCKTNRSIFENYREIEAFVGQITKAKDFRRKSNITSLENEVLMVLIYYRCYISHFQLGMYFNLDASNVCRHFQMIE